MDVVFEGEQAEELRERARQAVLAIAYTHKLKADIEVTFWGADSPPFVLKAPE